MASKSTLRKILSSRRKSLTTPQVLENSCKINNTISTQFLCTTLRYAIYLPFGNEVNLTPLLQKHPSGHIPSVMDNQMQFQKWLPNLPIEQYKLGISQPKFQSNLSPVQLDICFLPLLGFDIYGTRLGMGGGFYDRYFANNTSTRLVGVAHGCQQVNSLPRDNWDVKLHAIITESKIITP